MDLLAVATREMARSLGERDELAEVGQAACRGIISSDDGGVLQRTVALWRRRRGGFMETKHGTKRSASSSGNASCQESDRAQYQAIGDDEAPQNHVDASAWSPDLGIELRRLGQGMLL